PCRALTFSMLPSRARHRHLHSFPTRRSSDLAPDRGARRAAAPAHDVLDPGTRGVRRIDELRTEQRGTLLSSCHLHRQDPQGREADRKSTRLNSSHEWISYAVFCLKKKKKRYE